MKNCTLHFTITKEQNKDYLWFDFHIRKSVRDIKLFRRCDIYLSYTIPKINILSIFDNVY